MLNSMLLMITSSLVFALFHSLTASQNCKQWAYHLGLKEPYYRLSYSLLSILTTVFWALYIHSLPDIPLYAVTGWMGWLMVGVQALGGILAISAFIPIDGLAFLGLKRSSEKQEDFIVSGVYRYLRHPMYTGAMLIVLMMPEQSMNGLTFALLICVYFLIGSRFEEQRMIHAHPDYKIYQSNVPAFIPYFSK